MLYRVRKSWDNPSSQIGAFQVLENAISVCDEDYYVFDEEGNIVYPKVKEEENAEQKTLNLYDFNKMIISQMPDLTKEDIEIGKEKIHNFVGSDLNKHYFMLLCSDLNYYTMFIIKDFAGETISDVTIECLENLGTIKSIDNTDGNAAIEFWVQTKDNLVVAYLFNYDKGVILCER